MKSIIFLGMFVSVALCQFEQRSNELPLDTLAIVGTHIVTAADFLERYELMPWPHKEQVSRTEFIKLQFLYSMVAEKLLAIEASAQNIGIDSASLNVQRNLERTFVRDELYKQEVLPNIMISDSERREGMQRFPYEVEVEVLGIATRHDGELLHKKILQSKNKNSTFHRFRDSLFISLDTIRVPYGFADKKIEDAVFLLGKDSLSLPVATDHNGLLMFRLLAKNSKPQNTSLSISDRIHKVENIIKQRKEDSLAVKTFAAVTSPQRAEANSEMFMPLADSVLSILNSDSMAYRTNGMYKFPSSAIDLLEKKFHAERSRQFITIASGNMTLGEALQGLRNNNVFFPSLNPEHIRNVLNNNIKTVIQNELLAREGIKKNLQQSKAVRHDVATWMDNRKSWLLMRMVIDSVRVTDKDIESEYQKHPQLYGATVMVRIKEILVDSITRAREIKELLKQGNEFSTLAKKYSKRKEWAAHGGESPWIDAGKIGELGVFAASAPIGELSGPLMIAEGVTVFTVIERTVIDDSLKANFGKTRVSITQKLLGEKQQKTLDAYIGTLAKKYNVTMDESALRRVKTTTTSMVTWRNIGFGGRMIAVPQMFPQTEWVYEWLQQQHVNQ